MPEEQEKAPDATRSVAAAARRSKTSKKSDQPQYRCI
jgi:hypothetical protein